MTARDPVPLGLVRGMPFADYLAVDAVSASLLKLMARSPWHCKHRVAPTVQTRPMLRGSLVHCAQLEPDALHARYAVVPEDAPRRPTKAQWQAKKPNESSLAAMAWWAEFEKSCAGREVVTASEYAITQQQIAALSADPEIADLFSAGDSEVSIFWIDEPTGLLCKARPDHVRPHPDSVTLVDLKSTANESPAAFARTAAGMQYHIQQAHYVEGFEQVTETEVREFIFAAVTSAPPVLAVPYRLTDDVASQAVDERRELLDRYAWCRQRDEWPAYGQGVQLLDFPRWAKRSNEIEVSYVDD